MYFHTNARYCGVILLRAHGHTRGSVLTSSTPSKSPRKGAPIPAVINWSSPPAEIFFSGFSDASSVSSFLDPPPKLGMPKPNLVPSPHATGMPEGGPKNAAWQAGTITTARGIDLVMAESLCGLVGGEERRAKTPKR